MPNPTRRAILEAAEALTSLANDVEDDALTAKRAGAPSATIRDLLLEVDALDFEITSLVREANAY